MAVLLALVFHWYFSLFTQTFFLHRYAAHGSFRMSRGWERFWYIVSYIAQGSAFISPRAYAITHRMHHAFTDTEHDPHSPHHQKTVWAMMWRTRNVVLGILKGTTPVEARFAKNVPDWPAFDRWANSQLSRVLWVALYILLYTQIATAPWQYAFIAIHAAMGPIQGAIINWFSHTRGYRNFEVANHSENLMRIDLFFLGEAYHNNHHKHPAALNLGMKRWEFDPTYHIIRLFAALGMLQLRTPAAAKAVTGEAVLREKTVAPLCFLPAPLVGRTLVAQSANRAWTLPAPAPLS